MIGPLTPADCDLRDYPYLGIDIARLFDSEFHAKATDAEWRAGVTLWLKSFHQVPAASLPADDASLARLAEFARDLKSWRKVKTMALYGWQEASDGRLYHPVVAEKALEGWIEKLRQRKASATGNAKRYDHLCDTSEFELQIDLAMRMLASLNPNSKTLRKRPLRDAAAKAIGRHTDQEWQVMIGLFPVCLRCGSPDIEKDHVTPVSRGGSDLIDNLQPLCPRCNCSKGINAEDYRPQGWRTLFDAALAPTGTSTTPQFLPLGCGRDAGGMAVQSQGKITEEKGREDKGSEGKEEPQPVPIPSKEQLSNFSFGINGKNGTGKNGFSEEYTVKDQTARIGIFQKKLAPHLGSQAWKIIDAAMRPSCDEYERCLELCKAAAKKIPGNKGWPHAWPNLEQESA